MFCRGFGGGYVTEGKALKVLIVDDEQDNLKVLGTVLEKNNYAFETAKTGKEALEKVSIFWPDLVYLDVMLPELDGYEVCKRLKRDPATQHIPVIIITGLSDKNSRLEGLSAGANDFVTKPIDIPELMVRTQNLISLKELEELKNRHERELAERKAIENTIDRSNQTMRYILEQAPFGIYFINRQGSVEYSNAAMTRISGRSAESLSNLNVFEIPTYRQLGLDEKIRGVLDDEPFFVGSLEYTDPESNKTTIRNFTGLPLEEAGRKKALIFVEDITEQKRAEEALQRSEAEARWLAQENAVMAEIGQIISSTLNVDEVYDRFAEEVRKLLSFDRISINVVDPENDTARSIYIAGVDVTGRRPGDTPPSPRHCPPRMHAHTFEHAHSTGECRRVLSPFPGALAHFSGRTSFDHVCSFDFEGPVDRRIVLTIFQGESLYGSGCEACRKHRKSDCRRDR